MSTRLTIAAGSVLAFASLSSFPSLAQPAGPVDPPPLGRTMVNAGGSIGRTGGLNWDLSNVPLADQTDVWWGAEDGEVKLSLDGGQFTNTQAEAFDPTLGTWTELPNMNTARRYHTATRLLDGRVLVAGGEDDTSILSSLELFDPTGDGGNGTWTNSAASLATARKFHTATRLLDGRVLLVGGLSGIASPVATVEIYDPVLDSLTTWADTLDFPRYLHSAVLDGGEVHVAGGRNAAGELAAAEVCIGGSTMTCTAVAAMAAAHTGHAAVVNPLATGSWVISGRTTGGGLTSSTEAYDKSGNSWGSGGSLGTAREFHTATTLVSGYVLAVGGLDAGSLPLASAELYTAGWGPTGSLAAARWGHTATLLGNGNVLVTGGVGASSILASCELYDATSGTWSAASPMARAREGHTATLLDDGRVLVTGGQDVTMQTGEVMNFDPADSDLPGGIARWSGTTKIRTPTGIRDVCSRFTLTATTQGGSPTPIPLVDAVSLSLPADVGGLVDVVDGTTSWRANLLFEAAFVNLAAPSGCDAWRPHLEFFDAEGIPGGPPDAYSSVTTGFYYQNTPPQLTVNARSGADEGATITIDETELAATDLESPATDIHFFLDNDSGGGAPHNGALKLSSVALAAGDSFTQDDLDNDRVTYQHDGSETTDDSFQVQIFDGDGGQASDGPFTVFTHWIDITPVNDPPEAVDDNGSTRMGQLFTDSFSANDPDSSTLTFSVDGATKGVANLLDANTGAFEYQPGNGEIGTGEIDFSVSDGDLSDSGVFTVEIENTPPQAHDGSLTTPEDQLFSGQLTSSDPDLPPQTLVYEIVANGLLGNAVVTDANLGNFNYQPNTSAIGSDSFTFKVSDPFATSNTATIMVTIRPRLDEGDLVVVDQDTDSVLVVHPANGMVGVVSMGGLLAEPSGVDVGPLGEIYVMDTSGGLLRIDPTDGSQTQVSPISNFSSPPPGANQLVVDQRGNLVVADGPNGLVRVDANTGAVTALSSGGLVTLPLGVEIDRDDTLVIADAGMFSGGTSRVLRIHPISGSQTLVSEGGSLALPFAIDVESDRQLLVADVAAFAGGSSNLLIRVDPATGSNAILGSGGDLTTAMGIATDPMGPLFVPNEAGGKILQVDPTTGTPTTIASGAPLIRPVDVDVVKSTSCTAPDDLLMMSRIIYGVVECVSGGWLDVGDQVTILSGGHLDVEGTDGVRFQNGFTLEAEGRLTASSGSP